jgi:hypothetical protein
MGHVKKDPVDTTKRNLKALPWAEAATAALSRYREQLPSADEVAKAEKYDLGPQQFLENPNLRIRMLEVELAHMFRTMLTAIEETLDMEQATKVTYAAGLAHGTRRLGTFISGLGLPGGAKTMAMRQDTAHAASGARHTSALFARYDDELVEVVRTEDSFGAHTGQESVVQMAFFDGFIDGYKAADPLLAEVEEMVRERPDGKVEYVHRFWFRKGQS